MSLNVRMEELIALLNKHNYNYYVLDKPTISDKQYDSMYDELLELEKQSGIILEHSPSQKVGGDVLKGFTKRTHEVRLYSLNKVRSVSELEDFINDLSAEVEKPKLSMEYKFDGLTIVVEYHNGIFLRATTRGNGIVGEDVTAQVKTMRSVPLKVPFTKRLIIQGEGMMTLSSLEKYNKNNKEPLKNARNAVAGAIRNLDPKETAKRDLDLFAYAVLLSEDKVFRTQKEMHDFLVENGFLTGDYFFVTDDLVKIENEIHRIDKIKNSLDIQMDGLVLKLNEVAKRDEIGYTSKFPKWAIAYKFEALETTTTLLDVEWNVGRTGKVTPSAIIEPVELAGATVARATLNNVEDIKRKKLEIGSLVFVRRSNEVIPEILGLAESVKESKVIEAPCFCPSCGEVLVTKGPNLFCENHDNCKEQIIQRLAHFASREGMDIVGFSEKTAIAVCENLNIKKPSELYALSKEAISKLDKFKEKKTENLFANLEKSKDISFARFLYALGISEVGVKTSKELAKRFETLNNIKIASVEEIANIYDIGEVASKSVYEFFHNESNLAEIENLLMQGLTIQDVEKNVSDILMGKTVVLTGTLNRLSRIKATALIEEHGGQVVSSVSKNTSLVVAGENAGSKLIKANMHKIKILNEDEFLNLLGEL